MNHTDITNWLLPDDLAAQAEDMYYSTNPVIPVKEIYARLGLEYRAKPYLFQRFPPEDTGETCRHCGGPIKKFFLSKSTATMGNDVVIHKEPGHTYCYEKRCIQCGHHPEGPCHCQHCQDEQLRMQEQQDREKRDTLYCTFPEPDDASMLSFHDLSVDDRIRLSIAVLYGADENLSQILPPETRFRSGTLSQIIQQVMIPLFRKRILYISPMSDLDGFDWESLDEDSNLRHFYAAASRTCPMSANSGSPISRKFSSTCSSIRTMNAVRSLLFGMTMSTKKLCYFSAARSAISTLIFRPAKSPRNC